MDYETHEEITTEEFSQIADILGGEPQVQESDKLDDLQAELRELLGDSSSFGAPISVNMPDGKKIVYRQRKPTEQPEVEFDARRAIPKRAEVQKAVHDSMNKPKSSRLRESKDPTEKFAVAHELVEYVSGGGAVSNISRMVQRKPPEIHDIEDVADSIDWHLLKKNINSEHLETGLSKDQKKVILFMDDRAQPRMTAIKEVLSKFGEPRVLQKADDVSEATGQPHGFYVFEVEPDPALFKPKTRDEAPGERDWAAPDKQKLADSLFADVEDDFIFEDEFEPYCSTCGGELFERKKKKLPAAFVKNMSSEEFDAKVGDPKGKKKKDHPSTLGDSVICTSCKTDATPLDEHEFNGIFCARHGDRLDKYSRACYECQHESKEAANTVVVCPECTSETTMESEDCGVCGCEFNDGVNDFSAHVAESLFYNEVDDDILERENDWSDPFAVELADTLFAEVDEDPFD